MTGLEAGIIFGIMFSTFLGIVIVSHTYSWKREQNRINGWDDNA